MMCFFFEQTYLRQNIIMWDDIIIWLSYIGDYLLQSFWEHIAPFSFDLARALTPVVAWLIYSFPGLTRLLGSTLGYTQLGNTVQPSVVKKGRNLKRVCWRRSPNEYCPNANIAHNTGCGQSNYHEVGAIPHPVVEIRSYLSLKSTTTIRKALTSSLLS